MHNCKFQFQREMWMIRMQFRRNLTHHISFKCQRICWLNWKILQHEWTTSSWYVLLYKWKTSLIRRLSQNDGVWQEFSFIHLWSGNSFRCRVFACVPMSRTGEVTCTVLLSILPKEHRRAPMLVLRQQSKQVFEGASVKLEYQISVGPPPKLFW